MLVAKDSDEILGFTAFDIEASARMVAMQTAIVGHLPARRFCATQFWHTL